MMDRDNLASPTLPGTEPVSVSRLRAALLDLTRPFTFNSRDGSIADGVTGNGDPDLKYVPACRVEHLGDPGFCTDHRIRYPYLAGAMANGIGSAEVVEAMARAGMLGFFGAAGLSLQAIESNIERITRNLGPLTSRLSPPERGENAVAPCPLTPRAPPPGGEGLPFGFNLIHTPNEPDIEAAVVDLYLRRGIRLVEASAYLDLTLPLVRYRVHGIHRDSDGRIVTPNRIIAKVSRVEVATRFFSPPPAAMLGELVRRGELTGEQAELAGRIPMAQVLTAEADSAGHTDNRPALALLPTMLALRDRLQSKSGYTEPLRVGAAGGIGTPASAAAAFAMGAAYVLTGSVNQACVESGSSDIVREMLAEAEQADVIMAPAADMFEMGVKVQVLKRGTMFAMRAAKLYEIYRKYDSVEAIPAAERSNLEKTIFRLSIDEIWEQTRTFWQKRDPGQLDRAQREPKHRMALVFRWYLGLSSRWANSGEPARKIDYQVWCGPAMGAFNEWTRGTFLERPENRRVATVALNILYGAAVLHRANVLRCQGVHIPPAVLHVPPLPLDEVRKLLGEQRLFEMGERETNECQRSTNG